LLCIVVQIKMGRLVDSGEVVLVRADASPNGRFQAIGSVVSNAARS